MVVQPLTVDLETAELLEEAGGGTFRLCYQCGICTSSCPWNLVRKFDVRRLIHQARLGLVDFEAEDVWTCVMCKLCANRCPQGVVMADIVRALRRTVTELGIAKIPDSLRITIKNVSAVGNPLGEPREARADWAKDLEVKTYTKGTEILYFPCCYQIYDPSAKRVARTAVNILKKAGVDFGILCDNVVCCGESIRKAGNESVFQSLAQTNINAFTEAGVEKIVVTSPHCYHTFKDEYPEFRGNFKVIHLVQYLLDLIGQGRLSLTKEINKKVAYADSCCLGRYQGIYDEPREVLRSIPGLELVELPNNRENSICCGGCAGRLWMETKKGERFADIRIEQALDIGTSVLAVACPYCLANYEDSVLTMNKADVIEIKDISELVLEASG
jgi:Fe-S oxidoreductase